MIQDDLSIFFLDYNEKISEHLSYCNRYRTTNSGQQILPKFLISAFGDDFKTIRKTIWSSLHLAVGGQIFKPNLLLDRKVLSVSQGRTNWQIMPYTNVL